VIHNAPTTLREAGEKIRTRFDAVNSDLKGVDEALTKKLMSDSNNAQVIPKTTIVEGSDNASSTVR